MSRVKDILVKCIPSKVANDFVKNNHYSKKVVPNSQLHFGCFLDGKLHGVMSFGPCMAKNKMMPLVTGTKFNEFIELNRMVFDAFLPRNSESRCISIAIRMIRKKCPHIRWIITFADATQCGDGTIYRATGFHLIGIKKNTAIVKLTDGTIAAAITFQKGKHILKTGKAAKPEGSKALPGFQIRYIYFLNNEDIKNLTVPILPYSCIKEAGASMYKGNYSITRLSNNSNSPSYQEGDGGASPT